eukprot:jgi/Tetstr1/456135/TSEL_042904.t1
MLCTTANATIAVAATPSHRARSAPRGVRLLAARAAIQPEAKSQPLAGSPLRSALLGAAGSLALALGGPALPALAIGPESVPLEVVGYELVGCPVGVPKDAKCLEVTAEAEGKASKPAFNSEVFGKVRFASTGESALYGDFAEASDAGKMSDVPGEIKRGKNTVKFVLKLAGTYTDSQKLDFVGVKARTYPGMRQDFRIMKPVTATEDCPEAELGEPCEDIPF